MEDKIPRASIHVGDDKKLFSLQVGNEAERRGWDEKRYQLKNAEKKKDNHYNFTRKALNFEIVKGGKIMPLGFNPVPIHKRLHKRHDELGFKPYMDADHPGQLAENTPNCVVNILFGGDHDVMKRLAFGDQELDTSNPNADQSHIMLKREIYDWALDTYNFACRKWGEENIIGFCVHCDETSIHAHVLTVPVEKVKKRGRIGSVYVSKDDPDVQLSTKKWKELPEEERANYTKQQASKEQIESVSFAKVWGETKKEMSEYISQLHTDYHDEIGYKYGLERGIPYDELSDEEKRERKHKDKVTLEAERQAKLAVAQALQEKENAEKELCEIHTEKEEAEKDLKSAKSGIIAKFVNPAKHKKEEKEKHAAAVEEGKTSVMDAIIKATHLKFGKITAPEELGKRYRELWDSKRSLEQQVKEKNAAIAEKDKVIAARDKTIKELNAKVTKLTTEINGLKYKITLIDENAVTSLRHQLATQTQRANIAEENHRNLQARWNTLWENPEIRDLWEQIQQRKEREKREAENESRKQKDRYNDILGRLIKETAAKLGAFANTPNTHFTDDECISLYFGTIAQCLKTNHDPMESDNRTRAMDEIFNSINMAQVSPFRRDCCKNWTNIYAFRMEVDTDIINSTKAIIADMCLSDHYVSLMGSNGAAHTLTHWDGSQVQGLVTAKKKQGGISM